MTSDKKIIFRQFYPPIITGFLVLLLWEFIVEIGIVNSLFLPPPSSVIKALIKEYNYLLTSIITTLSDFAIGYFIGCSLAIFWGFIFGWIKKASSAITPLLLILSTIPIVTFLPLFTLWFGLNKLPVLLCGSIGAFFPTFMNTMSGVKKVDNKYIEVGKNLHVTDYQMLYKIVLPASIPHILNGLRVSVQTTFIITPVAEMVMGDFGLGGFIWKSADLFRTDMVILGQLTLGLLGLSLYIIINRIDKILLRRWK